LKRLTIATVMVAAMIGIIVMSLKAGGTGGEGKEVYAKPAHTRTITQLVKSSGEINPRVRVNLSAHVVAKIESFHVHEGDRIEKGQPFVSLERDMLVYTRDAQSAQVRIAVTAIEQARLRLEAAKTDAKRLSRLRASGAAPSEEIDQAERDVATSALAVREAEQGAVQARAGLSRARKDLERTTIFAPISGRVIGLNASVGEVVVSGTMNSPGSVIGTIADLSEIVAEVEVDETEIVHVELGQKAVIKVDALPDQEFSGRVGAIASSGFHPDNQPDVTLFKVGILIENPDKRLRPSMSARADIEVKHRDNAVVVPIESVVERRLHEESSEDMDEDHETEKVVFIITDGKTQRISVVTGIADMTHIEITAGLAGDEQIITGPYRTLKKLKDGEAVHPRASKTDDDDEPEEEPV
jgi:HlyD family secretion protein